MSTEPPSATPEAAAPGGMPAGTTSGTPVGTPSGTPASTTRRWWLGAAGAAAAAAGVGVAWWREQRAQPAGAAELEGLWGLSFESPLGGAPLSMAALRGRPLVINFWATWCPPCVEEMPLLDAFYRQHSPKGWQMVGLAIDQPSSVRKFLERLPVSYPIGLAGLSGTELARQLGNVTGGLPYTVVINRAAQVAQRRMGQLKAPDLEAWLSIK